MAAGGTGSMALLRVAHFDIQMCKARQAFSSDRDEMPLLAVQPLHVHGFFSSAAFASASTVFIRRDCLLSESYITHSGSLAAGCTLTTAAVAYGAPCRPQRPGVRFRVLQRRSIPSKPLPARESHGRRSDLEQKVCWTYGQLPPASRRAGGRPKR